MNPCLFSWAGNGIPGKMCRAQTQEQPGGGDPGAALSGEQSGAGLLKCSPGSRAQAFVPSTASSASHQHFQGCFCLTSVPGVYGLSTASAPAANTGGFCTKSSAALRFLCLPKTCFPMKSRMHFVVCFPAEQLQRAQRRQTARAETKLSSPAELLRALP